MTLNGNKVKLEKSCTLKEFLEQLNYNIAHVAVQLNGEIVPKLNFNNVIIKETDSLEVVSFVGGG